jgi:prepilin-type N-terminal cleavage/methylation domain-containing protein
MTHIHTRRGERPAFTLIELLVVIAIIAILLSLAAAGVMKIMGKANVIKARDELGKFDVALQRFMSENGVDYVPSYIVLREDGLYTTQIELDTANYLRRVFGKQFNPALAVHDWNGNGQIDKGPIVLEGQQALIFFLGGIPDKTASGVTGFSTNPQLPTAAGGTRKGPWFEDFQPARLSRQANGFFVYLDPWSPGSTAVPYAFFSSYGPPGNGYAKYQALLKGPTNPNGHDCPSLVGLGLTLGPYIEPGGPPARYTNPKTHQVITAGADRQFGAGGLWDPAAGVPIGTGADDMANFARGQLSAGTK